MPITGSVVTITHRISPIEIHEDRSLHVTVNHGYVDALGEFTVTSENHMEIRGADATTILDAIPSGALGREADLERAVCEHLVAQNIVAGTVS